MNVLCEVSIPVGFSDALRPRPLAVCDKANPVSIPVGFSDALRPDLSGVCPTCSAEFQSLLGFLMRCDLSDDVLKVRFVKVSIPVGFSDALRQPELF